MIRVVHLGSGSCFFTHPGSRGQKSHRIPDPDPQHWFRILCLIIENFYLFIYLFEEGSSGHKVSYAYFVAFFEQFFLKFTSSVCRGKQRSQGVLRLLRGVHLPVAEHGADQEGVSQRHQRLQDGGTHQGVPNKVLRIRDPVPFWPLDPGSGMGKKSGSGMNNLDHISES